MTEQSIYECDLTGDTFTDASDVLEVPIRKHLHHPFDLTETTIHLSRDALEERLSTLSIPPRFGDHGFVGVEYTDEGLRVVGYCIPHRSAQGTGYPYEERESAVGSHYEGFFELLESGEVFLL